MDFQCFGQAITDYYGDAIKIKIIQEMKNKIQDTNHFYRNLGCKCLLILLKPGLLFEVLF